MDRCIRQLLICGWKTAASTSHVCKHKISVPHAILAGLQSINQSINTTGSCSFHHRETVESGDSNITNRVTSPHTHAIAEFCHILCSSPSFHKKTRQGLRLLEDPQYRRMGTETRKDCIAFSLWRALSSDGGQL
jgi:hypothetical protein